MTYAHLLASIANTLSDYRAGQIPPIDVAHVTRWIDQFPLPARAPMLQELDHIFQQTYFSKGDSLRWFTQLSTNPTFVGSSPSAFWVRVNVLNLQNGSRSQSDMNVLLRQSVATHCTAALGAAATPADPYLYLDDFIFTGNSAIASLSKWIVSSAAPQRIELHIVVAATHAYGEYYVGTKLQKAAQQVGKVLILKTWRSRTFEDRKTYVDASEVFRPTRAAGAGDANVDAYVATLVTKGRPPVLRSAGAMPTTGFFSSPESRDVLEWELLRAGAAIRARCTSPKPVLRPMGYSTLDTLGFGAAVASFRNCPNNAPLAIWWGSMDVPDGALGWYPLLPRRQAAAAGVTWGAPASVPTPASTPSSDDVDDEDYDMPWETEAETAVLGAVESLEFDEDEGVVTTNLEEGSVTFENIEELRAHLEEVFNEQWYANVPFEGGVAVFEGDPTNTVDDALSSISDELDALGWEL